MSSTEDTSNFFQRPEYSEEYWDTYLAARPAYSQSFYQSIYSYHRRLPSAQFQTAHDIATGPGQVAAELSDHFDHVIASDLNPTHLEVAAHRLSSLTSSGKISL
ncbi:MAG: hypothetical protein LQ352_005001 [Teloschistes flavicans]|nr:MAG: hypothetical protein LQ352_005001 [Teloschistes flavicans]